MIQFNMLPDIKVQYIKAKKAKRVVITISILSVVVSGALLIVMFSATLFQKQHISDLNKDVSKYSNDLEGTADLAKMLTIQNQLNSLPSLYAQRPVASRLFGYVQSVTPKEVSFTNINVDFPNTTIKVRGTAVSLEAVNRFVDTLKFTTYTVKDSEEKKSAFVDVVLTNFTRDTKAASYTIDYKFDKDIFDASKEIVFNVPTTTTTRSETQLPSSGVFDSGGTN